MSARPAHRKRARPRASSLGAPPGGVGERPAHRYNTAGACGKVIYPGRAAARRAAREIAGEGAAAAGLMRAYRCDDGCPDGSWHLTSLPAEGRAANRGAARQRQSGRPLRSACYAPNLHAADCTCKQGGPVIRRPA